jgi:hypothetical protein
VYPAYDLERKNRRDISWPEGIARRKDIYFVE